MSRATCRLGFRSLRTTLLPGFCCQVIVLNNSADFSTHHAGWISAVMGNHGKLFCSSVLAPISAPLILLTCSANLFRLIDLT